MSTSERLAAGSSKIANSQYEQSVATRVDNGLVDLDALPAADELWWRFVIVAAVGISNGDASHFSHNSSSQVLAYHDENLLIAMQRLYHGRMVLWGRTERGRATGEWSGIPGWATSDAVHESLEQLGATFLLWHARDGWESATTNPDIASALAIILDTDIASTAVAAARGGSLNDADLASLGATDPSLAQKILTEAAGEAPPVQGTVRRLLAFEIEAQMRRTRDRDRLLPQRPVALVRWATVAKPPGGFTYAVRASSNGLVRTNDFIPRLAVGSLQTLHNVLSELYVEEASDISGGWLFARVRFNGVQIHLDRAFDGQPLWSSQAPSLEELADEMDRRSPQWRPAWTLLLPPSRLS